MEMSQQKVYRERQGKRQRQRRGVIKGDVEPQGRRWSQESVYRRSIQGTEARGEETETRDEAILKIYLDFNTQLILPTSYSSI